MPKRKKRGTNTGIPGLSFSWRRATGITRAKQNFARKTGIPTTRSGRQRKLGGAMGGCLVPILVILLTMLSIAVLII
jgi:hypothetical protein